MAVVGVGTFGRHHARVYSSLPEADLVAIADRDLARAEQVAAEYGCQACASADELPGRVRAASIAVPTVQHASVGVPMLMRGIDLMVEKPIASNIEAAEEIILTAEQAERVLQVGHLERFNPIVEVAAATASLPLFFEVHRMSPFSPRSLDIDVVLDLMIHDLDIVRSLVESPIDQIAASGLSVVSNRTDIASVRLQFKNGCVANLTASRVSTEKIRKLRFFQPREYVSIDYVSRQGVKITLDRNSQLQIRPFFPDQGEPLRRQLRSFLSCVRARSRPRVSGRDGLRALGLALRIRKAIDEHSTLVSSTLAARGQVG